MSDPSGNQPYGTQPYGNQPYGRPSDGESSHGGSSGSGPSGWQPPEQPIQPPNPAPQGYPAPYQQPGYQQPGYQPPGYQQPGYPAPYTQPDYGQYGPYPYQQQGSNGIATASLVLGIIGLVLFSPAGIAAVICGAIGLSRANRGARNKGQAIAGLITGGLAVLILIFVIVIVIIAFSSSPSA